MKHIQKIVKITFILNNFLIEEEICKFIEAIIHYEEDLLDIKEEIFYKKSVEPDILEKEWSTVSKEAVEYIKAKIGCVVEVRRDLRTPSLLMQVGMFYSNYIDDMSFVIDL